MADHDSFYIIGKQCMCLGDKLKNNTRITPIG